jgi:hypothetical protein
MRILLGSGAVLPLAQESQEGRSNSHSFHALDALLQTKSTKEQPLVRVRKLIFETFSEEWAYSRDHRLVWFVQRPQFRQSERIATLLQLLTILDTFMRGAGVQYWLDSGTLLGARRSQNIMSWDDDADVGILDESLPRLLSAIERTPPVCDDCAFVIRHNYEKQAVVAKFVNTTSGFYVDVIQFKLQINADAVAIAQAIDRDGEGGGKGKGVAAGVDGEHVNGNVRGRDGADMEANTGSRIHEQQGLPTQQVQFECI